MTVPAACDPLDRVKRPGTSKWNKVEHRVFSFITINWRGTPLTSYRTIVELAAGTTTETDLRTCAEWDTRATARPEPGEPHSHAFANSKGIDVALGEWGNRGTDAQAAAEMQAFYDLGVGSGTSGSSQIIGYAYFDSGLNSPTGSEPGCAPGGFVIPHG